MSVDQGSTQGRRDRHDALDQVLDQMQARLDGPLSGPTPRRTFLRTYQRTTQAVAEAMRTGLFEDDEWVRRWDVAFAKLYLDALDADLSGDRSSVSRPWRAAFDAPARLPALVHLLLGINAHVNYDLPQALLAVIPDADFAHAGLMERRRRDHERIDGVLASRVSAEDAELAAATGRSLLDRLLVPLNRLSSRRFLAEARRKVWHNTRELQAARAAGPQQYGERLAELELLSAAKIADLLQPGQVLIKLGLAGFGVTLPPPRETDR